MALNLSSLQTLTPAQYIKFTIPTPIKHHSYIERPLLHIAVLDSPIATANDTSPLIAAMIVPQHRENDWTFCTKSGHLQLLFNLSNISRLILIGNNLSLDDLEPSIYIRPPNIDPLDKEKLENNLKQLVIALHPKSCFKNGVPKPLFVTYEDDVVYRVIIDRFVGPFVGEFVVEDVEVESKCDGNKESRRRIRFKTTPNLIQSQVRIVPSLVAGEYDGRLDLGRLRRMKGVEFLADTSVLVHPYLTPMVSGLSIIAPYLNERIKVGGTPRALCLGVGGGSLLSFLNVRLGFEVVGVEADEIVLTVARQYFGLNEGKSVRIVVGDAMELTEKIAEDLTDSSFGIDVSKDRFDVVMVDLDSSDAQSGISAPPPEFVKKSVFQMMKSLVHDHGVVVINVIPPSKVFYNTLVHELRDVFHKVYEINVENDGNFVVMATLSPIAKDDHDNDFSTKLRAAISGNYTDSIVEL
ncbi:uncharacterized protein [Rutidosis leptorrhynchoides]|uniref:uncharacterized protein n=1 Tax=Rutidosis leptorrhynchoides TaxID=125765 RepID=UPI003A99F23D